MSFPRLVLGLASLLFTAHGLAASVTDRSPFAQGTWWDPTRSGSGFEIFNAAGTALIVWYTFDEAGRPVWYTAQGDVSSLGTQSWPLLQHRWANGSKADYATVGSMRLTLRHAELADLDWELRGHSGTSSLQPFNLSGTINEVDHGGTWFNPDNSGWGLTLSEQGEILGGGLFTYDSAGSPTWAAGYERSRDSVELFVLNGSCPWCTYRAATTQSVGRVGFEFAGEKQLAVRSRLTLPMAAGVNADGARLVQLSRAASSRPADRQLAAFDYDAPLKSYLDAGMLNLTFAGGADFSASPPAPAYSPTNLQEAGVDEADLVKTNGRYIYTFVHDSYGARQPAVRIARIGEQGGSLEMVGSVPLTVGSTSTMSSAGLYLDNETLVSVTGTAGGSYWWASGGWGRGTTNIEVMALANPGMPSSKWVAEIEGHVLSSRRIGQRLYVVSRFVPYLPGFVGDNYPPSAAANQQIIASTPLADMLPKMRVNGAPATGAVSSWNVYAPPQGGRRPVADMILVTAIDLTVPRLAQSLAIVGPAEVVYASTTNLFIASSRYDYRSPTGALLPERSYYTTDLHQLRLDPDAMSVVGSASVEGYLGYDTDKAPFRLSEYQGQLRAVTSSMLMWGASWKNRLTILEPSTVSPGLLKTVSVLPNSQRPESLGKPGELLYGTRFLGERLYAVTFKKVDPLYVVNLANSSDPRIAGAVELPGFSDYLHPLPNGLLLGFGKDARPSDSSGDGPFAWYQGLQLTLFDVSDIARPREIQRALMGKRGSDSPLLRDHHAFSALMNSDGSGTIAIPASIHDGPAPSYGSGDSAYYAWKESGLMRFALQGTGAANAKLVPLASLITITANDPNAYDPVTNNARSVLLPNGTIYVGAGRFWRLDGSGTVYGPF